jgi:CubicO group peptidase (beta-lactamase class C family)
VKSEARSVSFRNIAVAVAVVALLALSARAQEWTPATPESQGMDSAALAQLVEYGANVKMDSLVVVRHGRIVAEAYYAPYRAEMLHRINSSTKPVVVALARIAMARGDLPGADTPVLELLPASAPADPRWRSITLQHLMDMTSGMDWTEGLTEAPPKSMLEMEQSRDWQRFILQRGIVQAPGAGFYYNSGNSHLLALALARRTDGGLEAYARQYLFEPLGITAWRWRKDPQGVPTGGAGLYLHTRDMARLGQLYLQKGEWNGRQVVPRAAAERAFAPTVDMGIPGFAYADGWWAIPKRKAYFAAGFNRQLIMVLPELGVVAAVTGRAPYPFTDLIAHLERAAKSATALAANDASHALLQQRIAAVANEPVLAPAGITPAIPARSAWQVDDNRTGVREIALDLAATPPSFRVKLRTREFAGRLGLDGRFAAGEDAGTPVFTKARWSDPNTLVLEQRWPEEAGAMHFVLRFSGEELEFQHTNQFGVHGTARGRRIP